MKSRIRGADRKRAVLVPSVDGPYRDSPVPTKVGELTFAGEWARYRRLRRAVAFLGALVIPGLLLLSRQTRAEDAVGLFALGWGIFFGVATIRWVLFSCPRCRQCFRHPRLWGPWPYQRCQACALPMFALIDPDHDRATRSPNVRTSIDVQAKAETG